MLTGVGTLRGKAGPVVDQYSAEELQNAGRLKQIWMVAKLVNQQNKKALPITVGAAAGVIVVLLLLGLLLMTSYIDAAHVNSVVGIAALTGAQSPRRAPP